MDHLDEDLLERAYRRRHELLGADAVRWVRMTITPKGALLVIEERDGYQRQEWVLREPPRPGDLCALGS